MINSYNTKQRSGYKSYGTNIGLLEQYVYINHAFTKIIP